MEYVFTYPREKFDNGELTFKDIMKLVHEHERVAVPNMKRNLDYYLGKHALMDRKRGKDEPNNKPVSNHAKDIADISSGYFLGNPISYQSRVKKKEKATKELSVDLRMAHAAEVDDDHSMQLAIFGKSHEYIYREEGSKTKRIKALSPMETFVVVDDTIEHRKLFGVNYYKKVNSASRQKDSEYTVIAADDKYVKTYHGNDKEASVESFEHNLGYVPIIEYRNNKYGTGDFESVIGLIDAYNSLQADRVDDKDQFIDSILVIYGSLLGSTKKASKSAKSELKEEKLLELDEDARAEYLTHTLDEQGTEVLRKALKQDIYTLSQTPNLADENFAGNSSGVAMEYKLLSLEMKTKTKELWYRKALRERLQIFMHDLSIKRTFLEEDDVIVTFSRGLPKNILELSQILVNLYGKVSNKTLLTLLPFIEDPETELVAIEEDETIKQQQRAAMEGLTLNTPIINEGADE